MRIITLAATVTLVANVAFAADTTDPVKEVMDVTARNWGSVENEWSYIFDPQPLQRLFSREFQAAYAEAAKRPAYETDDGGPGDPFGYDVVTASQDGCPLEDVNIKADPEQGGVTRVKVTFKLWRCLDQPELQESVNEVRFDVVAEDGRYVISDIHRIASGDEDSVLVEMKQLAAQTD
ncbi:hypothetical protein ABID21_003592 [Pseudorhizobium tarimense]|uniref:DUF3828 domain-containing protein n=1 Tax=Pseudorhizobium tarimense TaxID=1079109 RepID=A0ABV2HB86_9HYPH|nr:hypothetical protein [Pseudorhizobium tarimense]MCJ8520531.1 hypothetical protein [Pseudorhizobium tarimense]